jgi:hypothetical protein
MSGHARLSASACSRWINCPGSLALVESLPPESRNRSSKYAEEGTRLHEQAALALLGHVECADRDIQPYVTLVRDMARGHTLLIEQRVEYSAAINIPGSFGTADAIIVTNDGHELCVIDLKTGRGVEVSAEENEQLMLYALGAIETFDTVIEKDKLERIRLVISQPRLNSISEWDCTPEYLEGFRQRAMIMANRAAIYADRERDSFPGYGPLLNPGEKQCRWCAAASICPALASEVQDTIGAEFENLDAAPPSPPTDNTALALKMKAIPVVEAWCSAVRAAVEAQLLQGAPVPGYKLVEGKRGNRRWVSEKDAEEMLKSFRFTREEMYDFSLISPVGAEKLLKGAPTRWKRLSALITRTDGKPSVAPETDKRPALAVSDVSKDFEDLSSEALA